MEILTKLQANIPLCEALEKMSVYAKFMKYLLTGKRKPKYDESISLVDECSAIIQCKLPPKLTDLGRFTIPCSIGSLKICHSLCDLGVRVNLLPLSMMRKLNCGELKSTHLTITLVD